MIWQPNGSTEAQQGFVWQPNGSTEAQQGFVLMRLLNDSKSDRVLFQPKTNSAVNRILATRDCIILLGRDGATPWLRAIDLRKSGTSIHEIPLAVNRILATHDCIILLGRDGATPWLRAIDLRKSGTSIHEIPLADRI